MSLTNWAIEALVPSRGSLPTSSDRRGRLGLLLVSALMILGMAGCQEPPVLTAPREDVADQAPVKKKPAKAATAPKSTAIATAPATEPATAPAAVESAVTASASSSSKGDDVFTVQNGDTLRIAFPGSPNLDTAQQIRPDGRLTLPIIGEVAAAGKTPLALEKELVVLYTPHLQSKEVSVTVVSASFSIFVSGAVLRPGKITTDRPISALEAIMEAGGFDMAKADTAKISIVRQSGNKTEHFTVNLKQVLEGRQIEPFRLRRSDIVHVPEKFTWF